MSANTPRKHQVPPITANLASTVRPLAEQPPFRPRGIPIECWGGAVAIDHSLQVYDVGPATTMCVASIADLTPRQRQVLADYMIALWQAFKDHPVGP